MLIEVTEIDIKGITRQFANAVILDIDKVTKNDCERNKMYPNMMKLHRILTSYFSGSKAENFIDN